MMARNFAAGSPTVLLSLTLPERKIVTNILIKIKFNT
ncbi:hypothetical protein BDGGKGIB_02216 [Nodularia sphaerocarpa UHCC 0038]|nr:hypothetical protein BDGGKGIB_02216 [Nodularia sphaerocarpa UHCC 0038]